MFKKIVKLVTVLTLVAVIGISPITVNAAGWTADGYDYGALPEVAVYDDATIYATALQYMPAECINPVPMKIDVDGCGSGYVVSFKVDNPNFNAVLINLTPDLVINYGLFGTNPAIGYYWFKDFQ